MKIHVIIFKKNHLANHGKYSLKQRTCVIPCIITLCVYTCTCTLAYFITKASIIPPSPKNIIMEEEYFLADSTYGPWMTLTISLLQK